MAPTRTASEQITETVTAWPGIQAGPGKRGELSFKLDRREIGHLHGDHAAHFGFPKPVWTGLIEQGRVVPHPVFPDAQGPAARTIEHSGGRRRCDRAAATQLRPPAAGSMSAGRASVALVTGGSRGLGRALTDGHCSKRGWSVVTDARGRGRARGGGGGAACPACPPESG